MEKKSTFAIKDSDEGTSPALREIVVRLIDGKGLQAREFRIDRELSGKRRFTAERLREILTRVQPAPEDASAVWESYFNGKKPDNMFELLRQSIVRYGKYHDFAKASGVDHMTLGNILQGKAPTYAKFKPLRPFLGVDEKEADCLWQVARGTWYMEDQKEAATGAHVDVLMEMKGASLRQWAEVGEPPKDLGEISKNQLKTLFRDLRAGNPVPWPEVVRLLNVLLPFPEERRERTYALTHLRAIILGWVRDLR